MTTWQLLTSAWDWEPSVVIGCLGLLLTYFWVVGWRWTRAALLFTSGVLVMLLALVSPVDTLGDYYLFSAHMLQHLLLIQVVPPLLLLGIPAWVFTKILTVPLVARLKRVLAQLPVAWLLSAVILWVWHVPALYDAALASENVHIFQHLTFLVSAAIFWWPVLTPLAERRADFLPAMLYLFTAGIATSALGIFLTFAPAGFYPAYLHPIDEFGALSLIRNVWGLSPATDQQLGGLLMWVPGGLVYLVAILGVLARWYSEAEVDDSAYALQGAVVVSQEEH
jgi:cytochrome c oxidase assembly factor CtaG